MGEKLKLVLYGAVGALILVKLGWIAPGGAAPSILKS